MLSIYFEEVSAHQYRNRPKNNHHHNSRDEITDLEIGDDEDE